MCAHCGNLSLFVESDAAAGIHERICISCRKNARITCANCGKHRRPAALNKDGKQICARCHERRKAFICKVCGKQGKPHSKTKCQECYWREYLGRRTSSCRSLLRQQWVRQLFENFLQELSELQDAHYAAMRVERYFPFFARLDVLFDSRTSVSAAALLSDFGADGLRRFSTPCDYLARVGVIEPLSQADLMTERYSSKAERVLMAASGKWYEAVLKGFRKHMEEINRRYRERGWKNGKDRYPPSTVASALMAALRFFEYAESCGIVSENQLHQHVLDGFVAEHPGYRHAVRTVLKYLNRHARLFRKLKLEMPRHGINSDLILPPSRCAELFTELLGAQGDEARNAVILLLMLAYAQPARRIVAIQLQDILKGQDGRFSLVFGQTEIALDPRISAVLERYLAQRKVLSMMDDPERNGWLFPGRRYGGHLTTAAVTEILRMRNLTADQLFATAIFNAYQTGMRHPKVLVKALGITSETAIRYLKLVDPRMFDEAERKIARKA